MIPSYFRYLLSQKRDAEVANTSTHGRFRMPESLRKIHFSDSPSWPHLTPKRDSALHSYLSAYELIQAGKRLDLATSYLQRAARLWKERGRREEASWAFLLHRELHDTPEHLRPEVLALVPLFFKRIRPDNLTLTKNISYSDLPRGSKYSLDIYSPRGARNFPVVIFYHGGGLTCGDKDQMWGSADVYANLGRYLASFGIGVVMTNYPLIPDVNYTQQVAAASQSLKWVGENIERWGGDPDRLFIAGYSAGGHLALRVALETQILIRGIVLISGSRLNLSTDSEAYRLSPFYYLASSAERFAGNTSKDQWQVEASPSLLVQSSPLVPPTLLLYGKREDPILQWQSEDLNRAIISAGGSSQLMRVSGTPISPHAAMMLTLSGQDKSTGPAMVKFIKSQIN